MHILRVANFVSPTSGGIKTALRHWGQHYQAQGHRASLIIPAQPGSPAVSQEDQGMVFRVPAMPIPGQGYSLIWSRSGLARLMDRIAPDALEVSDRTTTRWMGRWARRRGIPSVMVSHETLAGIMDRRTPLPTGAAHWMAAAINRLSAHDYDTIVCPSEFAAEEFFQHGMDAHVVPLGVDLELFRPMSGQEDARRPRGEGPIQLIHCGRLSTEKRPELSIEALRALVGRGYDVQLTVFGDGPMRPRLMETAGDLPVVFHPYITDRRELAELMSRADAALSPGPLETFGLAALEVLACGVPTVCCDEGALQEVVGDGGYVAGSSPEAFADAVLELLTRPDARTLARRQAERFNWGLSAQRMLTIHQELASR